MTQRRSERRDRDDEMMPLELPETDTCYFCDIIDGKADRWAIVEDAESTLVLLNGRQFETGQCIVVPKRHAPTLLELDEPELSAILATAQRAADAMLRAFEPTGILLYQNNGVGSAQEVPHFHLHVVPRRLGSDWGFGPPHLAELERRRADPKFDHAAIDDTKRDTVRRLAAAWPVPGRQGTA